MFFFLDNSSPSPVVNSIKSETITQNETNERSMYVYSLKEKIRDFN
jgi:hypothetical protein